MHISRLPRVFGLWVRCSAARKVLVGAGDREGQDELQFR